MRIAQPSQTSGYANEHMRMNKGIRTMKKQSNFDYDGQAGQAMVEAMVAMSVIVVGLLGAFALSSSSIGLNRTAADRYIAVNLAGEGIELVKNIIDQNIMLVVPDNVAWNAGVSPGNYEIDYNDSGLKSVNGDERTLFFSEKRSDYYAYDDGDLDPIIYAETKQKIKRIIKIENISLEHIKVTSTVSWNDKNGSRLSFFVEDHFYDFKSHLYKRNLNCRLYPDNPDCFVIF